MTAAVWRVVDRSGAVHWLRVESPQHPVEDERFRLTYTALSIDGVGCWYGPSPLEAVARAAVSSGWDVVEILPSGESTQAEAVAAERARCAAVCRSIASHDPDDGPLDCAEAIERGDG